MVTEAIPLPKSTEPDLIKEQFQPPDLRTHNDPIATVRNKERMDTGARHHHE
jgi:hypothetical protein